MPESRPPGTSRDETVLVPSHPPLGRREWVDTRRSGWEDRTGAESSRDLDVRQIEFSNASRLTHD